MWYTLTTAGTLFFFDYATSTFTGVYPLPVPLSGVVGVFVSPTTSLVYLAEMLGNTITVFNPTTHTFTRYPVPVPAAGIVVVRAETQRRYIWFTGFTSNANVRFDTVTEAVDVFFEPAVLPAALPTENTVDGLGRMWYSTASRNTIQYFDEENRPVVIDMPGESLFPASSFPFLSFAFPWAFSISSSIVRYVEW